MPFVKARVAVEELDAKRWVLLEPLEYKAGSQSFIVPKGFKTDFASIPFGLGWLAPSYGLYTKAAILHDYLYDSKSVSRADADGIFRRTMHELGVSFLRRWTMWAAVRFSSGLKGIKPSEFLIWLVVAVPMIIFLAIPSIVVLIWSAMFWVLEYIVFGTLKPFSRKKVCKPTFFMKQRPKY